MAILNGRFDPKPRMPTTALGISGATTKPYQPGPFNPTVNPLTPMQQAEVNPPKPYVDQVANDYRANKAQAGQAPGAPAPAPPPAPAAAPAERSYGAAWQGPGNTSARAGLQAQSTGEGLWQGSGTGERSLAEKMAAAQLVAAKNTRAAAPAPAPVNQGVGAAAAVASPGAAPHQEGYGYGRASNMQLPAAPAPQPNADVQGTLANAPGVGTSSAGLTTSQPAQNTGLGTSSQALGVGQPSGPTNAAGDSVSGPDPTRVTPGATVSATAPAPESLGLRPNYVAETMGSTGMSKPQVEAALKMGVYVRGDSLFTKDASGNEVYVAKYVNENGRIGTDNTRDENDPNDLAYQVRQAMNGATQMAGEDADAKAKAEQAALRTEQQKRLEDITSMKAPQMDTGAIDAAARTQRLKAAYDSSLAMRASLEGAANAGASPEYTAGAGARTQQEQNLSANAEESKMRLQYSIQDFQSQLQTNQNKIAALNQMAQNAGDQATREQANAWAMQAMQEQARIQEQLAGAQQQSNGLMDFIKSMAPAVATVIGAAFGPAGAVVAPAVTNAVTSQLPEDYARRH